MLHWFPANTHVHKKMSCQLSLLKCRLLVYGTHGTLPTRQWPMPCTVLDCFLLCFLQLHASYFTVEKFCVETWLHATQELKTSLQWLTTHSLLQYSSSHSELAIAALGQPRRMQVLPGRRLSGPGCCCCCCWACCCCCTGAEGPLGDPAPPDTGPPGGGLDTKCWSLRGGLMWCGGGTCCI